MLILGLKGLTEADRGHESRKLADSFCLSLPETKTSKLQECRAENHLL